MCQATRRRLSDGNEADTANRRSEDDSIELTTIQTIYDAVDILYRDQANVVTLVEKSAAYGLFNVQEKDDDGWTLLHYAAYVGHLPLLAYCLYVAFIPVNAGPPLTWTPLAAAARNDRIHAVQLLLHAGADPDVQDPTGLRPMDYARIEGHRDVEEMLDLDNCAYPIALR